MGIESLDGAPVPTHRVEESWQVVRNHPAVLAAVAFHKTVSARRAKVGYKRAIFIARFDIPRRCIEDIAPVL